MLKVKKLVLLLSLLVAFITLPSFMPDANEWKVFKPGGGNCSVLLPGVPEKQEKIVNTEIGELTMTIHMYQPADGTDDNVIYGISYADYPADMLTSDSTKLLKNFFDVSRDGAVRAVNGKLLSETIIKYRNYPGREQRVDFKNGLAIIRYRHYLVKNRLYTMQVITLTNKAFNKNINRFLESFSLDN